MDEQMIIRDSVLMEEKEHGSAGFPLATYQTDTYAFAGHREDIHWHQEFQLLVVTKNRIACSIGQSEFVLSEGEGLFINSGTLHGFSADAPCMMLEIIFHSDVIAESRSDLFRTCVRPFLDPDLSHLILHPENPNDARILALIKKIVLTPADREDPLYLLHTKRDLLELWECLYQEKDRCESLEQSGPSRRMMIRTKQMMEFISQHSREALTLEEIAAAANISRSEANRCFRQLMHTTPVAYLIQIRLKNARLLLETTGDSVTDIAAAAGFTDSNYFSRIFRKAYGCSPKEYRAASGK